MNLVLRAMSLNEQPLSQAIVGCFDEKGGTIGRSDTNTMTLPDPERHISRLQAEVIADGAQFLVRNAASANAIFVNGRALGPGERGVLAHHDELRIGGYLLGVLIESDNETVRTITQGRAVVDARAVIAGSAVEHRTDPGQMALGRAGGEAPAGRSASVAPPAWSAPPSAAASAPLAAAAPVVQPAAPPAFKPPPAPAGAPASNPFADLLGPGIASAPGVGSSNPFGDLLGPAVPAHAPAPAPAGYGPAPAAPAYAPPLAAPAYVPPPAAPVYVQPPAAPVYVPPPAAPVYAPVPSPATTPTAASATSASAGVDFDPFAGLLSPSPAGASGIAADPFAFLNTPPSAPAHAPAHAATPASSPPAGPARLPDDFDPFADIGAPPAAPVAGAAPSPRPVGANDLLGLVGASSGTAPSIDTSFGLKAPSAGAADPLAAFLGATTPAGSTPMAGAGAVSTDPLAMFGAAPAQPPAAAAAFNHTPELRAAYVPPPVVAPSPATPRPAPAQASPVGPPLAPRVATTLAMPPIAAGQAASMRAGAAPSIATPHAPIAAATAMPAAPSAAPSAMSSVVSSSPSADTDALWAAFCEGAGVRVALPQGLNPDQMRVIGTMLREATEGALRLMAVRATAKTELRAAVTTIRARNNNPLKFSPNAQAALEQLLQPPLRGFMPGPLAVQDAMHDLVGHSIGTMAGMRAALAGVLGKFEPAELESKLAGKSVIDSLLPMNRKAKLWDLYLQHFGSIREDAQDDFHTLFGAAFVAAYEDQLDRLAAAPKSDAG